jgi:hypothetical protein
MAPLERELQKPVGKEELDRIHGMEKVLTTESVNPSGDIVKNCFTEELLSRHSWRRQLVELTGRDPAWNPVASRQYLIVLDGLGGEVTERCLNTTFCGAIRVHIYASGSIRRGFVRLSKGYLTDKVIEHAFKNPMFKGATVRSLYHILRDELDFPTIQHASLASFLPASGLMPEKAHIESKQPMAAGFADLGGEELDLASYGSIRGWRRAFINLAETDKTWNLNDSTVKAVICEDIPLVCDLHNFIVRVEL